jgi:hypothetical protein
MAKPFEFLRLPTELRVKILGFCLCSFLPIFITTLHDRFNLSAQLLRTCRQVFHEGLSVLYGRNKFVQFVKEPYFSEFLTRIGSENAAMIKCLGVRAEKRLDPHVDFLKGCGNIQLMNFIGNNQTLRLTSLRSVELLNLNFTWPAGFDHSTNKYFDRLGFASEYQRILDILRHAQQQGAATFALVDRVTMESLLSLELRAALCHVKWSILRAAVAIQKYGLSGSLRHAHWALQEVYPFEGMGTADLLLRFCRQVPLLPYNKLIFSDEPNAAAKLLQANGKYEHVSQRRSPFRSGQFLTRV